MLVLAPCDAWAIWRSSTARKGAGIETRPLASSLFVNVETKRSISRCSPSRTHVTDPINNTACTTAPGSTCPRSANHYVDIHGIAWELTEFNGATELSTVPDTVLWPSGHDNRRDNKPAGSERRVSLFRSGCLVGARNSATGRHARDNERRRRANQRSSHAERAPEVPTIDGLLPRKVRKLRRSNVFSVMR